MKQRLLTARATRNLWHYGLLGIALAALTVFLIYPIALTVGGGFLVDPAGGSWTRAQDWTIRHISDALADPKVREGLFNSLKIATGTTTLAILLALPLAVLSAKYRFAGKGFFNAAILVPLILPPFVGAIGVKAILGRQGALNAALAKVAAWLESIGLEGGLTRWLAAGFDVLGEAKYWGVVAVQALALYPIIYLNATASLANLDPALDEAAENLGAGPWRRFFRITLPLVRPGLFAGATIVFIWSFTELGTPLMFDYYTATPVQIFNGLKEVENSARPYALTVILLTTAVTVYTMGKVVFGRKGHAMYSKASRAAAEKPLGRLGGVLATGAFAGVALLAVSPHLGVVLTSITQPGQWYQSVLPTAFTGSHFKEAMTASDAFGAIWNSIALSGMAVLIDLTAGLVIAYLLVRTNVRGKAVLDALCMLPLAVPGLVMAFGYVAMSLRWPFGKDGPLSGVASIFAADPNPVAFLVTAYAVRRLPYIVRSTVAGLEQTSGELEEAAINLGASRLTAVRRVIVPLIMANLIAGALLVFAFSMLEVSDSLILAQQPDDFPVTKAIWSFADRLGDGPYIASALGVWGMALLAVTLFGASSLLGKKLGSIFRV